MVLKILISILCLCKYNDNNVFIYLHLQSQPSTSGDESTDSQDYETQDNTLVLFDEPKKDVESSGNAEVGEKFTNKSALIVIKCITGRLMGRDEILKLLTGKFKVPNKTLTNLSPSQLAEILARKLIADNYVKIVDGANLADLKRSDLMVKKEIAL